MTTCPACGVSVVPGYVKCPRCGGRLPSIRFRRPGEVADAGGTAVSSGGGTPWLPLGIGVAAALGLTAALVLLLGRKAGADEPRPPPPPVAAAPARASLTPAELPPPPAPTVAAAAGPSPTVVADELQKALARQRLWSTVRVVGPVVELRSGACADPQLPAVLTAFGPMARGAGLTGVRCVEPSGAVAFTRGL